MSQHDVLPLGAVMGAGCLPFRDADAAVGFIAAQAPRAPFWPQLPRRSPLEGAVAQSLAPLWRYLTYDRDHRAMVVRPGALDDLLGHMSDGEVKLEPSHAAGFDALLRAFDAGQFPEAEIVKGQLIGPVSLALRLARGPERRPFVDHPTLTEACGRYLSRLAASQVESLRATGQPVLVVINEPTLAVDRSNNERLATAAERAVEMVMAGIRHAGGMAGLQSPLLPAANVLNRLRPEVYAFEDPRPHDGPAQTAALATWLNDGGRLVLGVHCDAAADAVSNRQHFTQWLQLATTLGEPIDIARRTSVMPVGDDITRARRVGGAFRQAAALAELLHEAAMLRRPDAPHPSSQSSSDEV